MYENPGGRALALFPPAADAHVLSILCLLFAFTVHSG